MKTLFKSLAIASAVLLPLLALQAQTRQTPAELTAKSHQQHTMMLLAQLELEEGVYSTHANDIIYAFIEGECRGTASPMIQHNGLIFLSIGENSEQPKAIELMVWLDERQELLPINETFTFAPLKAEGELHEPVILTLGELTDVNELAGAGWFIGEPYPNPFSEATAIPYKLDQPATLTVRVYNGQGQLFQEAREQATGAGIDTFTFNAGQLPAGMYVIMFEITSDNKTARRPFAVIKN